MWKSGRAVRLPLPILPFYSGTFFPWEETDFRGCSRSLGPSVIPPCVLGSVSTRAALWLVNSVNSVSDSARVRVPSPPGPSAPPQSPAFPEKVTEHAQAGTWNGMVVDGRPEMPGNGQTCF